MKVKFNLTDEEAKRLATSKEQTITIEDVHELMPFCVGDVDMTNLVKNWRIDHRSDGWYNRNVERRRAICIELAQNGMYQPKFEFPFFPDARDVIAVLRGNRQDIEHLVKRMQAILDEKFENQKKCDELRKEAVCEDDGEGYFINKKGYIVYNFSSSGSYGRRGGIMYGAGAGRSPSEGYRVKKVLGKINDDGDIIPVLEGEKEEIHTRQLIEDLSDMLEFIGKYGIEKNKWPENWDIPILRWVEVLNLSGVKKFYEKNGGDKNLWDRTITIVGGAR